MKLRSLLSLAAVSTALLGLFTVASARTDEAVAFRLDVDRTVLPANTNVKAIVKVALDGVKLPRRELRPPVNLALVIDRSGSMNGDKIAKAREAALEAVRQLAPDDIVSVVAYDSTVETLVSARRVGDRRRLEEAIRSLEATGNTALYGGVVRGAEEIRRYSEDERFVNRIILLSDGQANVGPSSPEELGRLGASLMREGVAVSTIGLGLGFNEDLMTRLAQRSDGNTYFVEDSSDLPRIFAAELGDVLSVVARRVVIEIEFPEGVRPLAFIGREGKIEGRKAEVMLSQLYGGQEKFALVEVEVSPVKAGRKREIARATVSYEDALNQRSATATAAKSVEFSADETAVVKSADHRVQADYAANIIAAAKDEAIALVDANQREAAGELLRDRAGKLARIAATYRNSAVESMAAPAAADAERIAREGLANAERKAYRTESAQTMNQQRSPERR